MGVVTLSTAAKTAMLNMLCRGSTSTIYAPFGGIAVFGYNPAGSPVSMPASPDVAGFMNVGSYVFTGGTLLATRFTNPSLGVIQLSAPFGIQNSGAAGNVTMTPVWARIFPGNNAISSYSTLQSALDASADLSIGIAGSGHPCIASSTGPVAFNSSMSITDIKMKVPLNSGTLKMSINLINKWLLHSLLGNGVTTAMVAANHMQMGYSAASGNNSTVTIHSGTVPETADDVAGTVLATYTVGASTDLFAAATGGSITFASLPLTVAGGATGTATYFRITKSNMGAGAHGTGVIQGTVGLIGSGADMILSTLSIQNGVNFTINAFVLAM